MAKYSRDLEESRAGITTTPKTSKQPRKHKAFAEACRYINPQVASLLRFEMFSEDEREITKEEKEFAVAMWTLPIGEPGEIYRHMRSEWRVQLPPEAEVKKWLEPE